MSRTHLLTALSFFASAAMTARAATFDNFVLTSGTDIATFSLPASPTPNSYLTPNLFILNNVPVTVDGVTSSDTIVFFNSGSYGGGLDISNGTDLIDQKGPMLFSPTTPVATPTFLTGSFTLTDNTSATFPFTPLGVYKENFNVTITAASTAATPEPSTFALLGTGILGLAGAARRRLKTA